MCVRARVPLIFLPTKVVVWNWSQDDNGNDNETDIYSFGSGVVRALFCFSSQNLFVVKVELSKTLMLGAA